LYSQPAIRYLAVSSALAAAISGKIAAAMKVGACKLHNIAQYFDGVGVICPGHD
jgi:hypothetical protein